MRGVPTPGTAGCGSAGGLLVSTGETLAQVQNRLLPIGSTINGVTVVNNDTAVPLFAYLPGYGLVGDAMDPAPPTIRPSASPKDVREFMGKDAEHVLVTTLEGELIGVVWLDALERLPDEGDPG